MDNAVLLEHLRAEGGKLADAARGRLEAPVPPCPGWQVRDVVRHTGEVHRWATEVVRRPLVDPVWSSRCCPEGLDGDGLLAWFAAGHRELLEALTEAPADIHCFAFLPAPDPLSFWIRRQAQETAMHRVDVELAAGRTPGLDEELAEDAIDEFLNGFARRRRSFDLPGNLTLHTPARRRRLRLDDTGVRRLDQVTGTANEPAAATHAQVAGSAADVALWIWNRPSSVTVSGQAELAAQWKHVRVG